MSIVVRLCELYSCAALRASMGFTTASGLLDPDCPAAAHASSVCTGHMHLGGSVVSPQNRFWGDRLLPHHGWTEQLFPPSGTSYLNQREALEVTADKEVVIVFVVPEGRFDSPCRHDFKCLENATENPRTREDALKPTRLLPLFPSPRLFL